MGIFDLAEKAHIKQRIESMQQQHKIKFWKCHCPEYLEYKILSTVFVAQDNICWLRLRLGSSLVSSGVELKIQCGLIIKDLDLV